MLPVFTLTIDAVSPGTARLQLSGHLDDTAAREVLHAAADLVKAGCARLVVDLDGLSSYDAEATYAVVGCVRLARWLVQGVDVVAGHGAGKALSAEAGMSRDQLV